MFENKTVPNITTEMLRNIDDSYEKTVGNPTADIVTSFAIESKNLWLELANLFNKLDVDLLVGDELTKYVLQRKAIIRKISNKAKANLTITGNGNIVIGDLFSTSSDIQFKSLESITVVGTVIVKVEALIGGINGNVGANSITQFPVTLAGIITCNNPLSSYDGFEEETDDSIRARYYEALQVAPTSGNKYHYLKWAKEKTGVGDAKVIPLWNGDKTVKLIIIDSNKQVASTDVVASVQNYIDPKGIYDSITSKWSTWGTGSGQAPIGAYCTVVSATSKLINIDLVDIQEETNYTLVDITNSLKINIATYLKEVAFKQDYVSYAKIGNVILNTIGVADYTTLTINGGNINIPILNEEVAILGVVNVV
ncbi:baseplate J/gp47 family protein [Clostridium sp. CF012]|uniref:baseplate J/gp47 family protein n=1 Tax=Clostridium sp. CF012 TaxID=2843319 RepID=UPI001C0DB574|nr:baseplate J/gp47 family protein [Clostridium sp. CF012]MBU3145031.1 baseplate J/gp47 family protein [Clostridium sp. CF012]